MGRSHFLLPGLVLSGLLAAVVASARGLPAAWKEVLRELKHYLARKRKQDQHDDDEQVVSIDALPQCRPLCSVDALLAWQPPADGISDGLDPMQRQQAFCAAACTGGQSARLPAQQQEAMARPKLLVCHDMAGGYKADRWVQGSSNVDAFRLWHWECVDVFVYFSHHMVTLPPPAWVRAARTHGTQVLGTFITEWAEGCTRCERLFASPSSAQQAAEQLAGLAAYYGFDGWLVNLENPLDPQLLPHLLHFLRILRARLKEQCGPQALLMWYDALTTDGKLEWQNHVNPLNRVFLDVCDAMYLNYAWKATTPAEVAALVGPRAVDVYLGVDVWGRGTYGGGQDACDVALAAAREHGVSAALFAPGWLYEAFPREGLQQRTDRWWGKVASAWPARPSRPASSLATTFCGGYGRAGYWLQGAQVSSRPWHDMGAQQLQPQPCFALLAPPGDEATCPRPWQGSVCDSMAFTGGSCLLLQGPAHGSPVLCQLVQTHLPAQPGVGLEVALAYQVGMPCMPAGATSAASILMPLPTPTLPTPCLVVPALWVQQTAQLGGGSAPIAAAELRQVTNTQTVVLLLLPDHADAAAATAASADRAVGVSPHMAQTPDAVTPAQPRSAGGMAVLLEALAGRLQLPEGHQLRVVRCTASALAPTGAAGAAVAAVPSPGAGSWSACRLQLSADVLPAGSVVLAAGVVCWPAGSDAPPAGAAAGAAGLEVLLGHLSVSCPDSASSSACCVPHLLIRNATCYPMYLPTISPQPTTSQLPTATAQQQQQQQHGSGTAPGATVPHDIELGLSSAPGVPGHSAVVSTTVHCDLHWGTHSGPTPGAPCHRAYHVWARQLAPDASHPGVAQARPGREGGVADAPLSAVTLQLPAGAVAAGEMRGLAAGSHGVSGDKGEESDALGQEAVDLDPGGAWTWLGVTAANQFHARVSCMAAPRATSASPAVVADAPEAAAINVRAAGQAAVHADDHRTLVVQYAVQPVRHADGLLDGELNHCAMVALCLVAAAQAPAVR